MAGGEGYTLEFTPTWVIAVVCTIIVGISLAVERLLHYVGKKLKKANQKPLFEALQKIKEELMLLGFISLLLTVFQGKIVKFCVKESVMKHLLPCSLSDKKEALSLKLDEGTSHIRHLLAKEALGYCAKKNKVPLLSLEALHHLHIFIFVLAVVHVTFSALTVVFGVIKIRQWKHWEDSINKDDFDQSHVLKRKVTNVKDNDFIKSRFFGLGKRSAFRGWLRSFFKQFYGSVTKSDYIVLRLGFISTHCKANPKFNFHKYMIRALEDDFRKVVGISWYLWVFVVLFLLMNVNNLNLYFWISFLPFFLLLAVGTKLEHIIIQLAHEVAEKHVAIEGELVVHPSDEHFWFQRPKIVLFFIHFILFQNAFEIAFFFWIWVQYGFDSCIMGRWVTSSRGWLSGCLFKFCVVTVLYHFTHSSHRWELISRSLFLTSIYRPKLWVGLKMPRTRRPITVGPMTRAKMAQLPPPLLLRVLYLVRLIRTSRPKIALVHSIQYFTLFFWYGSPFIK